VAGSRTATTRVITLSSLGEPSPARSVASLGSHQSDHRELTRAIEQQAEKCPEAQRLMSHPRVGALTAIAFVLIFGKADRFGRCKQIASYLGLGPEEDTSGERRRLGHHQQAGQLLVTFFAGGSGAGHGSQ